MHTKILCLLAVFLVQTISASQSFASCSKVMKIAWEDFPPYSYRDESGKRVGLDIDLTKAVLDSAGCQYSFSDLPWKRALLELEKGRIDIVAGASDTAERREYARFGLPYRQEIMSIFMRQGEAKNISLNKLDDIQNYKVQIAVVLGTWYGQEYEEFSKTSHAQGILNFLSTNENPFLMLFHKRVDIVFADYYSAFVEADSIESSPWLEPHNYILNKSAVHMMISQKSTSPADMKLLSDTTEKLLREHALDHIVEKYGFSPKVVLYDPSGGS